MCCKMLDVFLNNLDLRKYANHFTTPLSNVISDNMMSRLILILTKQFFDNQFTHFKIKLEKFCLQCKSLKGIYFVAQGLLEEMLQYLLFFITDVLSIRRHIFHLEKILAQ